MTSAFASRGHRRECAIAADEPDQHPADRPLARSTNGQSLDDLELALRKLPGVRSVGFVSGDDLTMVQLHVDETGKANSVPMQAARLACRHSPGSVAVEIVRWRTAGGREGDVSSPSAAVRDVVSVVDEEMHWIEPRVQIDRVAVSDDGLDVEVVLSFGPHHVMRKATIAEGLVGVASATLSALREFVGDVDFEPVWAHVVRPHPEAERMVAIGLRDDLLGETRTGIAAGDTPPEAAVRATLQALNRTLAARLPVLVGD
jgi:hypothetical protein